MMKSPNLSPFMKAALIVSPLVAFSPNPVAGATNMASLQTTISESVQPAAIHSLRGRMPESLSMLPLATPEVSMSAATSNVALSKTARYLALPEVANWSLQGGSIQPLKNQADILAILDTEGRPVSYQHLAENAGGQVRADDVTNDILTAIATDGNPFEDYFIEGGHTWSSPSQQFMQNNEYIRRHLSEGGGVAFMNDNHNVVVTLDRFGNPQFYMTVSPDGVLESVSPTYFMGESGPTENNRSGKPLNYTVKGFGPGAATSGQFLDGYEYDPFIRIPNSDTVPEVFYKYLPMMRENALRFNEPLPIMLGKFIQESGGNPEAVSSEGARGICQMMPGTAIGLGYSPDDLYKPEVCTEAGSKYISGMFGSFKDWELALAGYNAGGGAVEKYGGVPPYAETQNYVRAIPAMVKNMLGNDYSWDYMRGVGGPQQKPGKGV